VSGEFRSGPIWWETQHNTTLNTAPINAELLDLKNAEE